MCRCLAVASLISAASSQAAGFAEAVVAYNPGSGFAAAFTNFAAALGEPSRVTSGQFGGPVDPFSPPYLASQLVSVGSNGFLTVQFQTPILNHPANPFGLDFIIFGNAGFTITNGDFSGGGITDGSLFSHNTGSTRVSVSPDNVSFFVLNPSLAPVVDGVFPIDGSGDFNRPVNPALAGASFTGQDLAGIRALYAGSGGGAGFDIGWAQNDGGQSVALGSISFVRIEVLSGKAEIDGFAAVPEPAAWALAIFGAGILILKRKSFKQAD